MKLNKVVLPKASSVFSPTKDQCVKDQKTDSLHPSMFQKPFNLIPLFSHTPGVVRRGRDCSPLETPTADVVLLRMDGEGCQQHRPCEVPGCCPLKTQAARFT